MDVLSILSIFTKGVPRGSISGPLLLLIYLVATPDVFYWVYIVQLRFPIDKISPFWGQGRQLNPWKFSGRRTPSDTYFESCQNISNTHNNFEESLVEKVSIMNNCWQQLKWWITPGKNAINPMHSFMPEWDKNISAVMLNISVIY